VNGIPLRSLPAWLVKLLYNVKPATFIYYNRLVSGKCHGYKIAALTGGLEISEYRRQETEY